MGAHTQEVGGRGGEMAGVCAHGKGQGEGREREVMWMEVRAVGERSR